VGRVGLSCLQQIEVPILLEQLQLQHKHQDGLNVEEVLFVVNKFAESLIHLQLFLPLVTVSVSELETVRSLKKQEWKEKPINIPFTKLIKFKTLLCHTHSKWFKPFIHFKCPNLEQLCLYGDDTSKKMKLLKMLRKKCFKIAPNLKKISVVCGMAKSWCHDITSPPTRFLVTREIYKIPI